MTVTASPVTVTPAAVTVAVKPLTATAARTAIKGAESDPRAFFSRDLDAATLSAVAPSIVALGVKANVARCAFAYAAAGSGATTAAIGAMLADGGKARDGQSVRNDVLIGTAYIVHGVDGELFDLLHVTVQAGKAKAVREFIMVYEADFSRDALVNALAEATAPKAKTARAPKATAAETDDGAADAAVEVKVRNLLEGNVRKVADGMDADTLAQTLTIMLGVLRGKDSPSADVLANVIDAMTYTIGHYDAAADLDAELAA